MRLGCWAVRVNIWKTAFERPESRGGEGKGRGVIVGPRGG